MANKVIGVIKKNPGKTAAVVGVGVLAVVLISRGGGGGGPAGTQLVYGNSQYTGDQAGTGLALAQLQQQQTMHGNELAAQIQAMTLQTEMQRDIAEMEYAGRQDQLAAQIQAAEITAASNREIAGMEYAMRSEQMGYEYQARQMQSLENLHAMDTSLQIAQMQTSSQIEAMQINAATQIQMQQLFVGGQVALTEINAETQRYAWQQATEQQRIQSQERVDMSRDANRTQRKSSSNSMWGAVIGGALSLFCDIRIKNIEGCVSIEKCLEAVQELPLDHWSYIAGSKPHNAGDDRKHVGTYAQDFYRTLGVSDWADRTEIDPIDMMGVMLGSIKALSKERK